MIHGIATIEGTQGYAARHSGISFSQLGVTGLKVSPVGFGCYRVSSGIAAHENALRMALKNGVNLIDTSANYADGGSEQLVGHVLEELVGSGDVTRDQMIVVTKAGYLQGHNYTLSQERKQQGQGFEDLVLYDKDLEHCIHPGFLEDQLDRSLQRLKLDALDVFLIHNPEYYLGWAHKQGMAVDKARMEYYQRLYKAFVYLEKEVTRGRIRWYGVSSNTFPAMADDPEFTCLSELFKLADGLPVGHHFGVIQLPMNLKETGAILCSNQPAGQSVLALAHEQGIGVLINRPLNAVAGDHMVRLVEIAGDKQYTDDEIIQAISGFKKSEKSFSHRLLPLLNVPVPLMQRIAEQLSVGDHLKHYWRNFSTYERWRQVKAGFFLPRVQGVLQYLESHRHDIEGLDKWMEEHMQLFTGVLDAVGSMYEGDARKQVRDMRRCVCEADKQWCEGQTLSQMAVRAVRSSLGVSCVLVGMRQTAYVEDVLAELHRPVIRKERSASWQHLADKA